MYGDTSLLLSPGPVDEGLWIDPIVYNGTLLGPAGARFASDES